ncbi:unnamed protein product, partial [Allacma fusca]
MIFQQEKYLMSLDLQCLVMDKEKGNNNQVLLVFKESIEATNHPRSPKPTREITFGRKATTNSKTKLTSGEDSVSEWKTTTK